MDGLPLGPGPFIAALEYARGQEAVVVGKPEPAFYQAALSELGCVAEETVMIGDIMSSPLMTELQLRHSDRYTLTLTSNP